MPLFQAMIEVTLLMREVVRWVSEAYQEQASQLF